MAVVTSSTPADAAGKAKPGDAPAGDPTGVPIDAPIGAPIDALSDAEFHQRTAQLLAGVEATLDGWLQDDVIDIDSQRTGGLLELAFPDRSRIVINTQPPLHELWLASRSAGFHFRFAQGRWIDTRDGQEFFAVLSREASAQAGCVLNFAA